MSSKPQIRLALAAGVRFAGVLSVVKHKYIACWSLGGNNTGVLWHVAGTVHFAFMVNFDLYLNLARNTAKAAKLALLIVIMRGIELGILVGQLDRADKKVILLVRRVSAQDKTVNGVVFALRAGDVRQPLSGQARPLKGVGHHQVIKERCIFLPDLKKGNL